MPVKKPSLGLSSKEDAQGLGQEQESWSTQRFLCHLQELDRGNKPEQMPQIKPCICGLKNKIWMIYTKLQAGAKPRGCSWPKSWGYEPKSSPRAAEPAGFITTSQLKGGLG